MAALTENIDVEMKVNELRAYKMGVDVIYRGALVKINAAGFLVPCVAEAGAVFAGVAYEQVDNSAGSAGDKSCRVLRVGSFLLEGAGFIAADVGKKAYASDDQTISDTQAANEQEVGVVDEFLSATSVRVSLTALSQSK